MRESPRQRRLASDHRLLTQLAADSSIFRFEATGNPPEYYVLRFHGRGAYRPDPAQAPRLLAVHEVHVRLGAAYPRSMPELSWKSPVFHPNISAGGIVCLGGYGKHWVPSLMLDELCTMLWDMIRYENYDPNSPYNREAALWSKSQGPGILPLDPRPLRDLVASREAAAHQPPPSTAQRPAAAAPTSSAVQAEIVPAAEEEGLFFIDDAEPAGPAPVAGPFPPRRAAPTRPPVPPPRRAESSRPPSPPADDGIEFV